MPYCPILIIDDDPDDREFLIDSFRQTGVEGIVGVASAEAAFAFLQQIPDGHDLPRLIVTDLNMPGINGYEFLRALKQIQRYRHIPVIVCSTSSMPTDAQAARASGAEAFITKPATFSEYVHVTQQMCSMALA
ncbi:MAG: response regulator [Chitinophagaceae bacterium]|nr:MAG: response regulator [Chitinophagaceae bacterium]